MPTKRTHTGLFRVEIAGISDRFGNLRREGEVLKYEEEPEKDDRSVLLDRKLAERLWKKDSIRELTTDEASDYEREQRTPGGPAERIAEDARRSEPSAPEFTTGNQTPKEVGAKGRDGNLVTGGQGENTREALEALGEDELRERARALNIAGRAGLDKEGLIVAILASVE